MWISVLLNMLKGRRCLDRINRINWIIFPARMPDACGQRIQLLCRGLRPTSIHRQEAIGTFLGDLLERQELILYILLILSKIFS